MSIKPSLSTFSGSNDEIRNTQFGALKIKDAIVDRFRKKFDQRPECGKTRRGYPF